MKFRILVLSENLDRSRRLLDQFFRCNDIDRREYDQVYLEMHREGRLRLLDGTVLYARSVSQRTDRFRALRFNQVFTDLDPEDIPEDLRAHIEFELTKSEIPREFQWTQLCPDFYGCHVCPCCKEVKR